MLRSQIESLLFASIKPLASRSIFNVLKKSQPELKFETVEQELKNLFVEYSESSRGIVLIEKDDEITLGTAPELSPLIEKLQKEELNKELSKASLETLSIILYKNGISRSEIDYIRGVNSSFILRALSVRGLVERETDPKDNRRYIYKPSFELMSYMGIKSLEELPDWAEVNGSIEIAAKNLEEESKEEN